jgi:hypothetical protein
MASPPIQAGYLVPLARRRARATICSLHRLGVEGLRQLVKERRIESD